MRNAIDGSNPALCNTHRVVFADIGRPPQRVPGQAAVDVLEDLLAGEPVTRGRINEAISDLFGAWSMGGNIAQGYYPDIDPGSARSDTPPNFRPPSDFRPPPGWPFGGMPPIDPAIAELQEARRRARQVMGFAATEPLTKETLKARYRELMKKHHPDRGGTEEKTRLINAANDVLEAELAST